MEKPISFEFETTLGIPFNEDTVVAWLLSAIQDEGKSLNNILYTFCSDDFLLQINRDHLDHDYYTDIITFPYSYDPIESDIFISIDRVKDHAKEYGVPEQQELARVMVHGVLHMCGYNDHSDDEKKVMRDKENHYLKAFNF